jgi:hypothetical protein
MKAIDFQIWLEQSNPEIYACDQYTSLITALMLLCEGNEFDFDEECLCDVPGAPYLYRLTFEDESRCLVMGDTDDEGQSWILWVADEADVTRLIKTLREIEKQAADTATLLEEL